MRITRDHGASLAFPVRGNHKCNIPITPSTPRFPYFCPIHCESQAVDSNCAFSCIEPRARPSASSSDLYRTRSSVYVVIFVTLCLWRFSYCSADLVHPNPAHNTVPKFHLQASITDRAPVPHFRSSGLMRNLTTRTSNSHNLPLFESNLKVTPGNLPGSSDQRETNGSSPETKWITTELIRFICYRLPDPCGRAAYLRQHVRHPLCQHVPLLYLLPHVVQSHILSEAVPSHGSCEGSLHSLVFSKLDSYFDPWLNTAVSCERNLQHLQQLITDRLSQDLSFFDHLLERSFCKKRTDSDYNETGEFRCDECRNAYTNWLCASEFPLFYPLEQAEPADSFHHEQTPQSGSPLPHSVNATLSRTASALSDSGSSYSSTVLNSKGPLVPSSSAPHPAQSKLLPSSRDRRSSQTKVRLAKLNPCSYWCTQVETDCPYFNPHDLTSNGGEPAFLCDESHYHRSSKYDDMYRPASQCDSDCCFVAADLTALSSAPSDGRSSASDQRCASLLDRCALVRSAEQTEDVGPRTADSDPDNHTWSSPGVTDARSALAPSAQTSHASHRAVHNPVLYLLCILQLIIYFAYPHHSSHAHPKRSCFCKRTACFLPEVYPVEPVHHQPCSRGADDGLLADGHGSCHTL